MQDFWKNAQKIQIWSHEFQQIKILINNEPLLFVTNSNGDILVIDYQKNIIFQQFKAYEDYISCAAYYKKTQQLAVAGCNNSVNLFHMIDNQFVLKKNSGVQHFDNISQIYFSQKGTQLITCSYDQSIYVWNSSDLAIIKIIDQLKGKIRDMSICKKFLLTTITQEGVVCLYNVKNLKNIRNHNKVKLKYEEVMGNNVKFMNNKQILVQTDDKIRFISFLNSKILRSFSNDEYEECSVIYFSRNDKFLIAISYKVRVYEIATGIQVDSIITKLHSKIFYQAQKQNLLFSYDPSEGEIEILELIQ